MFSQIAVFSSLALLASVTYAIPSTYTSLHAPDAMGKRMVTSQGIFWLKNTPGHPVLDQDYQGPLGTAIAVNPTVHLAFQEAWDESYPTPTTAQEEGGWIYADPINPARIAICRAAHGRSTPLNQDSVQGQTAAPAIDLNNPESNPSEIPEGFVVVANFHTHPMPWDNSDCPSSADNTNAWARGVPGIIIHSRGICVYGPPARDSLKASTPGYPKQGQVYSGQKSAGRQLGWAPARAPNQAA